VDLKKKNKIILYKICKNNSINNIYKMNKPLGSFPCPNLIKSAMNNVKTINLTEEVYKSKKSEIVIGSDFSFRCEFKDVGYNVVVTGKYDPESLELTLYNELIKEEIIGENALISFALITKDGKTMNCCSLCSNNCYGSNGTLAPTEMRMNSEIDKKDNLLYRGLMLSDDKTTECGCNTILPVSWPKIKDYKNIQEYLIDCCKLSLYFRNSCLTCSMCHCNSLNQRLSSLYC
jgi:hypothetical protein